MNRKHSAHLIFLLSLLVGIISPTLMADANERIIKIVTESWEPIMGPNLLNQGFLSEVVNESYKRAGYRVEIDFIPWARAVHMTKSGDADVLLGAYYTKERAAYMAYSNKLMDMEEVLFAKISSFTKFTKLDDLKHYRIGVVRGAAHSKEFDDADFLEKVEYTNLKESLDKFNSNEVALIAGPKEVILHLIRMQYTDLQDQIIALKPAIDSNQMFVAISKAVADHKEILTRFNEGLAEIVEDGTYDAIAQKHGFDLRGTDL